MNYTIKNLLSLFCVFCLGFVLLSMPNEWVCLDIKDQHVCLRILRSKSHQRRGFQLVEDIRPNEGLLYILADTKKPNFWMRDVIHHLDIVFVDEDGYIVDLVEAKPHRSDRIKAPSNAWYAIELPKGTAHQLQLSKGSKIALGGAFSRFH